jgi:hypothetical protein
MSPENRKETTISWWEVINNPLYRTKFCRSQHRDREITCVWRSSPVTMLPTVRRAGMRTDGDGWSNRSTRRRQTPASITAWILSLVPSERYERAQQASVRTSSSFEWMRRSNAGSAGFDCTTKILEINLTRIEKFQVIFKQALENTKYELEMRKLPTLESSVAVYRQKLDT